MPAETHEHTCGAVKAVCSELKAEINTRQKPFRISETFPIFNCFKVEEEEGEKWEETVGGRGGFDQTGEVTKWG